MKLSTNARELLERYIRSLHLSLAAHGNVDAHEVEDDIRAHITDALQNTLEPVRAPAMQRVLDAMGTATDWLACSGEPLPRVQAELPDKRCRRRDDWQLAYVSLALLLLAFALPPFLWIGAFGAFLTARASLCAARSSATLQEVAGQHWLRNPALILAYIPAIMLLLLWPAIAIRFSADFIVDHPDFALRLPIELAWLAERIAQIRLSNFEPGTTLDAAVRSGHWLVFPVGCWLMILAGLVQLAPRSSARVFRPFIERGGRTLAGTLLFCGFLLMSSAVLLALLKLTLAPGSLT